MLETVKIEKLIHGGQGLGTLADGKKVLVWNALPGETVEVELRKSKHSFAEGIAQNIIEPSMERKDPQDDAYLSTSPWQIMSFEAENKYKLEILHETFEREKVADVPQIDFVAGKEQWHYRSKMEYSFWADDDGLHLALFHRGSHGKRIITGSSIARPEIDETANKICAILNGAGIRGSQLKTVMLRCSQAGEVVVALFVKDEKFPKLDALNNICKGVTVCFSNPKSPASILTKTLYTYGDITLTDKVLDTKITYDVHSFFQVNLPVFEMALMQIDEQSKSSESKVDFYSGVGTIGIPVNATVLVESDKHNIAMAQQNIGKKQIQIIHTTAETALDHIPKTGVLIVDPPRAGLHKEVTEKILETKPDKIIYLSCNPITQARDIALLQASYKLTSLEGYNFFPRTPHIESLAILHVSHTGQPALMRNMRHR